MMIDGVILLWFVLTGLSLAFIVTDIRTTPASPVLKWGFILLVAYTGVFGLVLYMLGCREPMRNTHERFVKERWRQVLGSTMHCAPGDGLGILVGAVIASVIALEGPVEIGPEYLLGFGFGWAIFQALFMRDMAGGSFARSLRITFVPELVSMNVLMAAMVPVMMGLRPLIAADAGAATPAFWFVMSMALLAGFVAAFPMNWWFVANNLKHGMITVRRADPAVPDPSHAPKSHGAANAQSGADDLMADGMAHPAKAVVPSVPVMVALSFAILAVGLLVAGLSIPELQK